MSFSNTILCLFLLLNLATFRLGGVDAEPQVPCFFIFGDSLVDNGNNNFLNTTSKANYFPYGIDFPAGPTGRFTNGRNIADVIAEMLGFDESIPPFANATLIHDLLRGLNYGSGGAGILDESASYVGRVISMDEQLRNHDMTISRIVKVLGSREAAREHLKSCLYYVGMGNNDYLSNYLPKYYSSSAPIHTPKQFAAFLIEKYSNQLRRLYYKGARKVAVLALGKLGCVPQQLATYGSSDCVETSNAVVRFFNEELELLINRLNHRLPNAEFLYAADISDDASYSYGNITALTVPCCPLTGGKCVEGTIPCSNRDEYYFWDSVHPTEAAVLLSANLVYNALSPLLIIPSFLHSISFSSSFHVY